MSSKRDWSSDVCSSDLGDKFRVRNAVQLSIFFRIADRFRNDFYTVYLFSFLCHEQRNRANPAISINHDIIAVYRCVFERLVIKLFRLWWVNLIERLNRNGQENVNAPQI